MLDSDQPDSGRPRGHSWRRVLLTGVLWFLIPAGLVIVAVAGSLATYRSVQAAEGHGTKGYFVCCVSQALGEFRLPDGQVTRQGVKFADPPSGLTPAPGAVIPALDTGDVTYVFARHGSRHWVTNAGLMLVVVAAFGAWLWFVPLRRRRLRRRTARAASGPGTGAGTVDMPGGLTVLAAASRPHWATQSMTPLSGDVSMKRVNTALRRATDRAAYPLLVTVGVALTDADRAMYPVSGESARLAELTATVTDLIGDRGVLAATLADSGGWVFLIYTGSTGWLAAFGDAVRSAAADHQVAIGGRRDPKWQAYRKLTRGLVQFPLPLRVRFLLVVVVPLVFAILAARYGPGWAVIAFLGVEAWALPVAFLRPERALKAQLTHPAIAFLALCGVLVTVLFPLGAVIAPGWPWICVAVAAALAVLITAAVWPAQRRFYARMRARAALQPDASWPPTAAEPPASQPPAR